MRIIELYNSEIKSGLLSTPISVVSNVATQTFLGADEAVPRRQMLYVVGQPRLLQHVVVGVDAVDAVAEGVLCRRVLVVLKQTSCRHNSTTQYDMGHSRGRHSCNAIQRY